ncbi:nose resistant to fluoxetine protein 6-like isoform X1 [Dysidea avara]|uniref:nose resistant to fluoxetine protein 6-like isoform X1 n=1 Tax=Dysidea avara TaxID=196820 RepID=UPI00331C530D
MMIKTLYLLLIVSNVIAALSQHQSFPSTIDVSESCEAAIRRLSTLEVTEPTLMAQYWDSWGKPNHGMMYGHTVFLGYYDECIDLKNTAVGETKYCIYAMEMNSTTLLDSKDDICHSEDCPKPLNFNASTSIEIGVCYPSACSPNEFATVLSRMDISSTTSVTVDPFNNVLDTHITKLTSTSDVPSFCPQTDPEYDGGTVAVIVVLAVLVGLVVIGTSLDFFSWLLSIYETQGGDAKNIKKDKDGEKSADLPSLKNFITAFSLCSTVPTLLNTKQSPSVVKAVNAIKVLALLCEIVFHAYMLIKISPRVSQNIPHYISKFHTKIVSQPFMNITFAVDTFFLLSGTLSSYLTFKDMEKHKRFRFWYFYVNRYFRLAPMLYLATFVSYKLFVHFSQGALWSFPEVGCSLTWWLNVFFINNYAPAFAICVGPSWHVSADMQLFVISPIFILALYHGGFAGVIVLALGIVGSTATIGVVAGRNGFMGAMYANPVIPKMFEQAQYLHSQIFYRINPYLVGILLGYILYKKYSIAKLKIANSTKCFIYILLWLVAIFLCSNTLFGTIGECNGTRPFTDLENIIFLMFGGLAWSIGVAIIIYNCNTGYGGMTNAILSWPGWDPLVRLSYGVVLFHMLVMFYIMGTMQTNFIFTNTVFAMLCVNFAVGAFSVSAVFVLIAEIPISKVVSLCFKLTGTEIRSK